MPLVTHHHPRLFVVVVAALALLAPFSIDTYLPSFPAIADELAASPSQLQQTLGLYLGGYALMTLVYGPLADRIGRRPVLLVALLGYLLCSLGAAMAQSIDALLAMRFGQGLSAAAGIIVGRAMVRDIYDGPQAQRTMSRVMLLFALGPALAPVIGGWLHIHFGWRSVFLFLALLGLAVASLIFFGQRETLAGEHRRSIHPRELGRAYAHALGRWSFLGLLLVPASTFAGFFLYLASAPRLIYEHLGLGTEEFAVLFVPVVLGIIGGSLLSSRMAGSHSLRQTISVGLGLMAAAALLNLLLTLFVEPTPLSVVGPLALYAVGMSGSLPSVSLMVLDSIPERRGLASSLQGFVQMSGNAAVAGVLAAVLNHSLLWLALGMMGFNLLALALWTSRRA